MEDASSSGHATPLAERFKGFAASHAQFNKALMEAMASVGTDPAAALGQLDGVLAVIPGQEAAELALIDELGPSGATSPDQCRERYHANRIFLLDMRHMGATLLASSDELARTRSMARAALADTPDDPFWAKVMEWDAEAVGDEDEREKLLDEAFRRELAAGQFLDAARNRSRAGDLAGSAGRVIRQRACLDQAVDTATGHDLRREAIGLRLSRFRGLLILDQTGRVLDALRAELDFLSGPRGALPDALEKTYADGLAQLSDGPLPVALAAARAFGLTHAQTALVGAADPHDIERARLDAAAALSIQRDEQRLELLLLAAEFKLRLNNPDTPIHVILPMAEALARTPEALCRVFSAYADAWEAKNRLPRAIAAAQRAVEAATAIASAQTRAQADARLRTLRAASDDDGAGQRDPAMDPDDFVSRRSLAVLEALRTNQPARALAISDPLVSIAKGPASRGQALLNRGIALFELDRVAEAERDFVAAGDLFEPALDIDPGGDSDLLAQRETAFLLAAAAQARLGRALAAWESAERARSAKLRRALGIAASSGADWPMLRDVLANRRAAMLSVCALHWGTLILSAGPGDREPQATLFHDFRASDMNRLLSPAGLRDDTDAWNAVLMGAIPELSATLIPALSDRLLELAKAADVLYLMPDAALWYAPWAALEIKPGLTFCELIPFSLLPFAALLTASGAAAAPHRNAVALATGTDVQGFDFASHLALLTPLFATLSPAYLSGAAATAMALRGATRDIVYLSAHGTIDREIADVDRASCLAMADGALASGDIAGWSMGPGRSPKQLTFLNACQSGRFRPLTSTEMGGFPAAFMRAGRSTLISPLTHVDPHAAGAMAVAFFTRYLAGSQFGGPTAARALQAARLNLKAAGAPASDWAAHTMFGPDC